MKTKKNSTFKLTQIKKKVDGQRETLDIIGQFISLYLRE